MYKIKVKFPQVKEKSLIPFECEFANLGTVAGYLEADANTRQTTLKIVAEDGNYSLTSSNKKVILNSARVLLYN